MKATDQTRKFIDHAFFQSLSRVNTELIKLDNEQITMKQFRAFILEQRVRFAEQVLQFVQDIIGRSIRMEKALLSIGKEILEDSKQ